MVGWGGTSWERMKRGLGLTGSASVPIAPAPCPCDPQGELTITTDMEDLSMALFYDTVPETWMARAYPSMMGLAAWYADLLLRIRVRTVVRGAAALTLSKPAPRAWGVML